MRDMIASEILLESEGIDLFGDPTADLDSCIVRGKLRLFLAKPRRIARIYMKFTGQTQTKVLDDLDDQYPTVQVVDSSLNVIATSTRFSAGLTDIPFELSIPGDIPASCSLPKGHIAYTLSVEIILNNPLNKLMKPIYVEKPILVRRSFVTGLDLLAYMPSSRCRGTRRRTMMAEFEAPKVVCQETGRVAVHGKVLGCFNKIVMRLEQLAVYRLCSNDPKRPTSMGPLFDKPVVENTVAFEREYDFENIAGDVEEEIVAEIETMSPKTPLFTDVKSPLIEVCHRLRINIHWVDKKEQTMSLAYPLVVSTLPFKDVSARALADLAPPTILWTHAAIGSEGDEHVIEDVRHDNELPSYGRLIPTSRPSATSPLNIVALPSSESTNYPVTPTTSPTQVNPPTSIPIPSASSNSSTPPASVLEDSLVRAMRSVRYVMTQDAQGVGSTLAKMFP
ncbi:hypothetical protein BGW37DRAFT_492792 [Umbelopsis sp. PMI_123]|nr:hypothetical protein BGW37DRAFT_492792 [Umbelopsis sp. PMI_123]